MRTMMLATTFVSCMALAAPLLAQAPPPAAPHKTWVMAASGGLAITSGNTDTSKIGRAHV